MSTYIKIIPVCLLAAVWWGRPATAADIMEAYRDAVATNPALRQAIANSEAVQEQQPQARAGLLPRVDAGATYTQHFSYDINVPRNRFAGVRRERVFDDHSYDVTLTQPLYDRAVGYRIQQAESNANQASANVEVSQQDLVIRVAESYFQALAALDNLTFRIADKNAIARQLEQAKRRFEVGLITVTDVAEAQALYDLAVADELDARKDLTDRREALRVVTGKYYDQLNVLDEKAPLDPVKPADPEAWVKIAMENNPQIQSALFQVESSRANIQVQRSGHYPLVDLQGRNVHSNQGATDTRGNEVGLRLQIPLFSGGAVSASTRQAAYEHEAAKERLEQTQRDIIRQVRDAYIGLETARSRVKALEQAVISSRSRLEATQAGFDVGTRTVVEVLNAERDLLRAERDLSLSRYDYILNRLRLLQAAGRITGLREMEAINAWLRLPKEPQPR